MMFFFVFPFGLVDAPGSMIFYSGLGSVMDNASFLSLPCRRPVPKVHMCDYLYGRNVAEKQAVDMSEWLRRQTRNLLGFACAGSNPAVDVRFLIPNPRINLLSVLVII